MSIVLRGSELCCAISTVYEHNFNLQPALIPLHIEKIAARINTHNHMFGRGDLVGIVFEKGLKSGSYTVKKQYGSEVRKFRIEGKNRLLCLGRRSNIDKPFNPFMK